MAWIYLDVFSPGGLYAQGAGSRPMDRAAMNLSIGNDVALTFGLLFARTGSVISALPSLLGVAMPVRIRVLLAGLIAASLMPLASIAMPVAAGIVPVVILMVRELAIGLMLAFAAAVVVGAVMTSGSVIGG